MALRHKHFWRLRTAKKATLALGKGGTNTKPKNSLPSSTYQVFRSATKRERFACDNFGKPKVNDYTVAFLVNHYVFTIKGQNVSGHFPFA